MKETVQKSRDYSNATRGIARSVAKHKAKRDGIARPCHKPLLGSSGNISLGMKAPETPGRKGRSWFSEFWQNYIPGRREKDGE